MEYGARKNAFSIAQKRRILGIDKRKKKLI
jgi:hypothetical protein